MNDPTKNIGIVLKKIRVERNLTLEDTSNITGVSKAMLGQIERGESNPSISILWKISTGLKISISELLEDTSDDLEVININELNPILESDGKMELIDVFSFDPVSGFECFYIRMHPGAVNISQAHRPMSQEYIILTEGELDLVIDGRSFKLKAPAAINFKADVTHEYRNTSDKIAIFQNIVKY